MLLYDLQSTTASVQRSFLTYSDNESRTAVYQKHVTLDPCALLQRQQLGVVPVTTLDLCAPQTRLVLVK